MKSLSDRFVEVRKDAGFEKSRKDFCDAVKINYQTYSALESGRKKDYNMEAFARVCDFTGANPLWLATGKGLKYNENRVKAKTYEEVDAINKLLMLDPKSKQNLFAAIEERHQENLAVHEHYATYRKE